MEGKEGKVRKGKERKGKERNGKVSKEDNGEGNILFCCSLRGFES